MLKHTIHLLFVSTYLQFYSFWDGCKIILDGFCYSLGISGGDIVDRVDCGLGVEVRLWGTVLLILQVGESDDLIHVWHCPEVT